MVIKYQRAVVRTNSLIHTKFYGARTSMSIYGPKVSPTQYSSGLMALGNSRESIEVGWTVRLLLYVQHLSNWNYLSRYFLFKFLYVSSYKVYIIYELLDTQRKFIFILFLI